jgi:trans-2,3-dihydro-3-hydroxyanthranilate isomerase
VPRATSYRYRVVDVFTTEPLAGNPLAVFPEAADLAPATMQQIAKELNLAETVFVLPPTRPDCVARLRIFTPARELAFAGHPTVGTGFVLLDEGALPGNGHSCVLEEAVGPVPLHIEWGARPLIWLQMPALQEGRSFDAALCASVLGLERQELLPLSPQLWSAGNPTVVVAARDQAAVDRAWLDAAGLRTLRGADTESCCVFLFAPTRAGAYARMFAPEYGIPEDPASGSCIGPLAAFMLRHGLLAPAATTRFVSEQGTKMGRRSLLHVEVRGGAAADGTYVGGYVTPIVEAVLTLAS